jgi:hypothetical protein
VNVFRQGWVRRLALRGAGKELFFDGPKTVGEGDSLRVKSTTNPQHPEMRASHRLVHALA